MSDLTTKAAEIRAGMGPAEKFVGDLRRELADLVVFEPPACDAPACIGGECGSECERYDRSREHWLEDSAHRLREVASPERLIALLALIEQQAAELAEARKEHRNIQTALMEETARTIAAERRATTAESERVEARVALQVAKDGWRDAEASAATLAAERNDLRGAIFGSDFFDPAMSNGCFVEMARETEAARQGAVARAVSAEAQVRACGEHFKAAESERERLGAELAAARAVMRNAWGAVTSDQVVDKQVDKMLRKGIETADAALSARPALENGPAGLADAHSKSPVPSSQSERIAVLEECAFCADTGWMYSEPDLGRCGCGRTPALAPLGEE